MAFSQPIDAVYTWVDGSCPDYQKLCYQYSKNPLDLNPERYRDQYHLLKYSLRSIEKYVPWLRNIYIFTCRPQIPNWLNVQHPQIHIIHHDEVFDCAEYLPTFNSNCIDSHLHLIPSISDYFLYMNDDFLFGNNTTLNDFVTEDGKIKILGTLVGEKLGFRLYEKKFDIIPLGLIEHTPMLAYKPYWQAMLEIRAEEVKQTRSNRFRTGLDVRMDKLYRYFLLINKNIDKKVVPIYELLRYHHFHKITNFYLLQKVKLQILGRMRPKFYCFNDDQRDNPNPQVVKLVKDFLARSYPEKSQFEK